MTSCTGAQVRGTQQARKACPSDLVRVARRKPTLGGLETWRSGAMCLSGPRTLGLAGEPLSPAGRLRSVPATFWRSAGPAAT